MNDTIGIDVSKDKLDIFDLGRLEHRQFANSNDGLVSMTDWINGRCSLIVFEASGIYHRELETHLSTENLSYSKVNPRQARRFAQAMGKIAKTDKVDAEVLAKMGAVLRLTPQDPKNEYQYSQRDNDCPARPDQRSCCSENQNENNNTNPSTAAPKRTAVSGRKASRAAR